MTKKIAFLMPVFPPHYDRAKNFINSFMHYQLNKQADLWFVFSSTEDQIKFPSAKNYIIMPEKLKDLGREDGVINAKKFYGISKIKNKYKYIIVVDADMEIMNNINLYSICQDIFNSKILWGTPLIYPYNDIYKQIEESCTTVFNDKNINSYAQGLGYWFFNLCVYDTDTLDDFFEKTNLLKNLGNLNFWSFDHYIYMFYLLAYKSFEARNILNIHFSQSKGSLIDKYYIENHMCMCTKEMLVQLKKLGNCKKCFIHLHLDRPGVDTNNSHIKLLRRLLSCFIPSKSLRRKIRGC